MYPPGTKPPATSTIHRWRPMFWRRMLRGGRAPDADQREWLRGVSARKPRPGRVGVVVAVALTLLLHVAAYLQLIHTERYQKLPVAPRSQMLEVRLIEGSTSTVPSPPPPKRQEAITVHPSLPAPTPPEVTTPVPAPPSPEQPRASAITAHLFDDQGRVVLPAAPASTPATASAFRHGNLDSRHRPSTPQSPIEYQPTVFNQYWVPDGESLLHEAVRKTLVEHTFHLPGGLNVTCVLAPLALAGGCMPTAPEQLNAPLQVENKRNNLASATPLIQPDPESDDGGAEAAASSTPGPAAPSSVAAPASSVAQPARAASTAMDGPMPRDHAGD